MREGRNPWVDLLRVATLVMVMLYRPQGLMGVWELLRLKRKAAVVKS